MMPEVFSDEVLEWLIEQDEQDVIELNRFYGEPPKPSWYDLDEVYDDA